MTLVVLLDEPTAGLDPGGREEMPNPDFTGLDGRRTRCLVNLYGGDTIVIEVDDRREELTTALAKQGMAARIEGLSVLVEVEREEQYDTIRNAIIEAQVRLRRMAP